MIEWIDDVISNNETFRSGTRLRPAVAANIATDGATHEAIYNATYSVINPVVFATYESIYEATVDVVRTLSGYHDHDQNTR